ALIRVDDHHLGRLLLLLLLLLGAILDTGGQPELQPLVPVLQDPQLCHRASAHRRQQGGQRGAALAGAGGAVCQSLSCENLQVHGGRARDGRHWGQQGGMGGMGGRGRFRLTFLLLLPLLLLLLIMISSTCAKISPACCSLRT
uniref:Uncharacterized protein n=1 Tax=Gasterosteus aculeatus TaxID=69293 RepID=G3P4D8_GASAC